MRRLPIVPTLVVALAVAIMVALGVWQLQRRVEKEAFIAQVAANPSRPPVAFPRVPDDRLLFRRSTVDCRPPLAIAKAGAGNAGFRLIATCAGGERVQLGTTRDPLATVRWPGGAVAGHISHAPDARPLIAGLFAPRVQQMLLVADTPQAGLVPNAVPDAGIVPNNHLAYAVQWFLFAAIAAVIYLVAVTRRVRSHVAGSAPGA